MLAELVRLALVVGLLVVLPGVLLVNAVLPPGRSSVRGLERAYLSVAGGALLLMLVGVVLGFLPHSGQGYFETLATGMPSVELAMIAVCVLLGYVGLRRGAYPRVEAMLQRRRAERPETEAAPPASSTLQTR